MTGKLILKDGTEFDGLSFGAENCKAGEVVFSTGMVGYPESLTDPSFAGQILILTYPIIGNYGVPPKKYWESNGLQISGLIVSNYIDTPSHYQSERTLSAWLKDENIPALEITDTRFLAQKIRDQGVILGKIVLNKDIPCLAGKQAFYDPNKENLVEKVSIKEPSFTRAYIERGETPLSNKTVLLIDCGAKKNIEQSLLKRGVNVITIPWDFDPFSENVILNGVKNLSSPKLNFDAILISNGPGDPKTIDKTIMTIKTALDKKIPTLGICLGHQLLALAAEGDTYKLKFGHRSQNQPCIMEGTERCYITVQNHGFAVGKIPKGFKKWFTNANDGSNEGIIHEKLPFMSVQFHPESNPGPKDTEWIFDYFLEKIK